MHSNPAFWNEGQTSEWCGEFVDSDHHTMIGLAKRFGLTLDDVNAAEPPGSVDTNDFLGGYYLRGALRRDMQAVAPVIAEQRKAIGSTVRYDDYTKAGYRYDHMSVYDWIETYVPGGHGSRLGRYLDVLALTENGPDTRAQSALNLLLPGHSDERYHIAGGNERLPAAVAGVFPAGTVQTGARMTSVAQDGGGVSLTIAGVDGERVRRFDRAILALPFSVLRSLDFAGAGFRARKVEAIRELGYGTNTKLSVQFDSRFWNGRGRWPGIGDGFVDTDLPFEQSWDSSRAQPGADGLMTDYTGGAYGASFRPDAPYTTSAGSHRTAEYARRYVDQLNEVWPGARDHYLGLATLSYPTGDPNLRGSYSSYEVGQYTGFAGVEQLAEGRIHFAGEHTSLRFQGFMEGGAESGVRAAGEVARRLAAWA